MHCKTDNAIPNASLAVPAANHADAVSVSKAASATTRGKHNNRISQLADLQKQAQAWSECSDDICSQGKRQGQKQGQS